MVLMIAEMSEAYRLNRGRDWRVKAVPQFEIGAGPGQYETMIGPPDGAWLTSATEYRNYRLPIQGQEVCPMPERK
jgi:hypothetical protein